MYLFGNNAGIGIGLPALWGEPGEGVRIEPPSECDAGYHRNAEQRQPPGRDEAYHQPSQERR